jgi:hypothetical protein
MTVPGELSYWITDCWYQDSAQDKLEARIDQALERIYDALPSQIGSLDRADQQEALLVLLMVARHCHNEALKGEDAQKGLRVFTEQQMREGYVQYLVLQDVNSQIKEIAELQEKRDEAQRLKHQLWLSGAKQLELAEAAQ